MPKRAVPIDATPAWDILGELHTIADERQIIPNEHALYVHMVKRGYSMTVDAYRYYFSRLQKEGHIRVDQETRGISILARRIVPVG